MPMAVASEMARQRYETLHNICLKIRKVEEYVVFLMNLLNGLDTKYDEIVTKGEVR